MFMWMSPKAYRALAVLVFSLAAMAPASAQVVISQVYGGGGNSGATYKNDFIELFNTGSSPVSLSGWSVQYASATGTSWQKTDLTSVTLQPGQYYLIQEAQGTGGTTDLPTPDVAPTTTIALAAGAGKVALVSNGTLLSGACPALASPIVDFVGFGTTANCYEGAGPTPAPSNTTAVLRANGGCTDTNNNASDFTAVAPTPRNTSSPLSPCSASPTLSITTASPLTAGQVSQSYSTTIAASGGTAPYTFSVSSGALPPGLSLNSGTGVLSGTPTTAGSYAFTVGVTDGANGSATKSFNLVVNEVPTCSPTQTIAQIQGSGATSPFVGQTVTTSGIVTGVKTNGFFLQMPSPGDGDASTSDGVFVFTSSAPPAAAALGNSVCVTGKVAEFASASDPNSPTQTEIGTSPAVFTISTGNALPAPIVLTTADTNPAGDVLELEKYEGMRVQVNSLTVVGPTDGTVNEANATATSNGIFYGVITGVARPFREPGVQLPDPLPANSPCCVPRFDANPEVLSVNTRGQAGGTALDVVAGAVITNVVGPLEYANRAYTIDTDPSASLTVTNNSTTYMAVPAATANELTVAAFNLERFFDTTDDPSVSDVALTQTAFNNRLNKASLAIRNVLRYPDILAVEEMENLATLQALATKINNDATSAGDPNPNYQPYLVEGNDVGGIDVGFLVKTPKVTVTDVTQYGKTATYIDPGTNAPALLNDRPPLVLRATATAPGSAQAFPIIVIANHLRSLNGIDDPADGPRVRAKREAQAEYLANLIQTLGNGQPNVNIAAVGDFNAFQFNDGYVDVIGVVKGTPAPANQVVTPPAAITSPALTDLVDTLPADQRYSYNFSGNAQVLDHILVNPNLQSRLTRFAYGRVDADFPEAFRNDPNRPERISDHDPAIAYFSLPVNHAPVATAQLVNVPYNGALTFPLSVSDPDNDTLTFSLTSSPRTGTVTFNNAQKTATYTPALNSTQDDFFTYTATDPGGLTASARVAIQVLRPGQPSTITAISTPSLSTVVGTQFAGSFSVVVKDVNGSPVPNASISFGVPTTGPSATFPNGRIFVTAITDASGMATAPPIVANMVSGSYNLTAAVGIFSTTITLTNLPSSQSTSIDHIGIFRSSGAGNILWVRDRNGDGLFVGGSGDTALSTNVLGAAGDQPLIGDWNGNRTKKLGVYRPFGSSTPGAGLFVLDVDGNESWNPPTDKALFFPAQAGDIAVVGRWSGGTQDRVGIFRKGVFYLDVNGDGSFSQTIVLGQAGDIPVVGDWNGDGRTKVGVFRSGLWVLDYNGNGQWDGTVTDRAFYIGAGGDQPVIGDWNGDGRAKVGVFRKSAQLWVLDYNGNGQWDGLGTDRALFNGFDTSTSIAVVGDWTGDGKTKAGVFKDGTWFLDVSGDGSFSRLAFLGQAGDTPITGGW